MKRIKFYITTFILFTLILVITTSSKCNSEKQELGTAIVDADDGFVVMELFTSQGCSSCPAADNLLGKYAAMNNEHIIPLAFHVDYWNRLGWTDSFSSAKYSQRQRDYAMIIDKSSVYTPQLIINGEKEFIGSDDSKIFTAVSNSLKVKAPVSISVDKIEKNGKDISVNYTIDKMQKNITMQAALVQKKVFTNILRGENGGLKLTNYNVVRDFKFTHINNSSAQINLNLPSGYDYKDFQVVLYIQDDTSGKIIGAIQKSL